MSEIDKIRQKKLAELKARSAKAEPKDGHPDAPVELTDSQFEEFIRGYDNVVVDCWAPWCGPCRMLSPTIEAMAMSFKGRVVFGKLNTDENYETAGKFGISSIPTLLFFKKGQLAGRTIGALPRSEIEKQLEYLESL